MNRFNSYMANHFGSCRLLAYARDHCRNRDVRIYCIPGDFTVVGVSDGTDAWVAPASNDIMSVPVKKYLDDLQAGREPPKPQPLAAPRRRLLDDPGSPEPPLRRRLPAEPPATQQKGGRRVLLA